MKAARCGAAILLLAGLVLAGCGDDDDADGRQTVSIGVLAPLDAGLTQFGRGIRNSVQLAVDEATQAGLLPGWNLRVVAVDDSSDPQVGADNARQLLADQTVLGVVGTYNSGVAAAVLPDFAAANLVLISPGNTSPALTRGTDPDQPMRPYANYFRMVAHDGLQGGYLALVANTRGIGRVAVVTDEKQVSQGLANDFRSAFIIAGGGIVSFEVVPEGDTNYAPYAQRAAAANPELLFFGGEYDHAALLKQAAVAAGLTVPLMGGDGIQADEYIDLAGAISEGDLASSVGRPVAQAPGGVEFAAAYAAHGFDTGPSNFGPYAYDAANILLSAARHVLAGRDRVDVTLRSPMITRVQTINNAALINPSGAVTGTIGFDAYGDTLNPVLTAYEVQNRKWARLN